MRVLQEHTLYVTIFGNASFSKYKYISFAYRFKNIAPHNYLHFMAVIEVAFLILSVMEILTFTKNTVTVRGILYSMNVHTKLHSDSHDSGLRNQVTYLL